MAIATVHAVVLETADPEGLARFYSDLLGWPIVDTDPEWYTVRESKDAGQRISFQLAPGHQAPAWPDPASPMQFHIDYTVDDLDAAEQAAIKLGATKLDHQPSPTNFRVFADPSGHPFCLCA